MSGISFEDYLRENELMPYSFSGVSMLPMLRQGRDTVMIRRKGAERCKKYDVALYRRGADYVLHRVVEVRPEDYVILGDNCLNLEPGITDDRILGVLCEFTRDGKPVSVESRPYQIYSRVWVALYPVRKIFMRARAFAGKVKRRFFGKK